MCQNGYNIETVPVQQQQKEHINRKKSTNKSLTTKATTTRKRIKKFSSIQQEQLQ